MSATLQTLRTGGTQHPEQVAAAALVDLIQASGIKDIAAGQFLVTESAVPALSVLVAEGYAHIRKSDGSMLYPVRLWDGAATVAITANSSGNNRIDAIVLYIDLGVSANATSTNVAKLIAVPGTPAGSPVAPDATAIQAVIGASNPYLLLATVAVANGASTILNASITDSRVNTTWGIPGKRSVFIPAAAILPSVTAGCADPATLEYTSNKIALKNLAFDASTQEHAQFGLQMPDYWNEGTITAIFEWSTAGGTNGHFVIWGIQALALGDDDAIDAAWGTAKEVTDAKLATDDMHRTAQTAAMTPAGSPAAGDWVQFRVYRKAADGGDTLAADALLLGVYLIFSTTKFDTES